MSKHTRGQWRAELGETYNVRAEHGGIVAQIHHLRGLHGMGGRVPADEAAANARLIARAPKMESLITRIYTECDDRDGGGDARFSAELYEELGRFMKEMQK